MLQGALVGLLVALCALHVAWRLLLPAAWRRRVALTLLRWRWPPAIASRLERRSRVDPAGACAGCDHRPAVPTTAQAIRIVRRARR